MDWILQILKRLNDAEVEYVVIGGVAAVLHGSAIMTRDLDICAPLQGPNLPRILIALREIHPRLRMRPDLMPLPEDLDRLSGLKNLYLLTDLGVIDFLGEVTGLGDYGTVAKLSKRTDFGEGVSGLLLDLDALIDAKRAANRDKDRRHLLELETIRKRRQGSP